MTILFTTQSFLKYYYLFSLLQMNNFKLVSLFIAVFILVTLISILPFLLAPSFSDVQKLSAYECGFDPFQDARMKFNIHFYIIAILFLIFDLEIVFLFPWAVCIGFLSSTAFWSVFFFLILLAIGFIYEWEKGVLDWNKKENSDGDDRI